MKKVLGILASSIITMMLFQNCQKSEFSIITGVVRDSLTNFPIEGAYVIQNGHSFQTASDGTFSIEGVQPGKITFFAASLKGYNQKYTSVIISNGRVNKVNFELSPIEKPQIETGIASNVTLHSATIAGRIVIKNGIVVNQYGFCWSSSTNQPSLTKLEGIHSFGSTSSNANFSYDITNLLSDRIYYVRAYASSNAGTIYGNSLAFRTSEAAVQGLISSHSFDGANYYQDNTGNFNYSYLAGNYGSTTDRNGNSDFAAQFNGGRGVYFNNYGTPYEFEDFAISFWFKKPGAWEAASQKLFTIGYPWVGTKAFISQSASPNNFYFGINPAGIEYRVTLAAYPSANTWHHLVAQRKGSKLQLYLDGNLAGETTCSIEVINNYGGWMFIGFTWFQEFFVGEMDEVNVYDKALSTSEIQYLKIH